MSKKENEIQSETVGIRLSKLTKDRVKDMARWENRSFSGQISHMIKVAINDYYEESKQWRDEDEEI